MKSVVSSLWSLVGFGQRRRLETAELTLRAALAVRDEYLRQLNDALAACEELRRQRMLATEQPAQNIAEPATSIAGIYVAACG